MATSVLRRFWIDLDSMLVSSELGSRQAVQEIVVKLHDSARWGVQFHRGGVPELLAASSELTFGVKEKGDFAGSFLTSATTWTAATTVNDSAWEDTDFYYATISFNTAELETAIGTDPVIELISEFQVDISGSGMLQSTRTIPLFCEADVIRGDEGVPTAADPPYPSAAQVFRWLPAITSLTGGTSADLDSIATTSLTPPYSVGINDQDTAANRWSIYVLKAGTDAESSPNIIRPDDYNASTNAKVWKLQSLFAAAAATDVSAPASMSNYTPANATVGGHLNGIDTALATTANIVNDTTPQLGGNLDANSYSIQFDDATGIQDDSGNWSLRFQKTANATAYIEITNANATSPSIAANGTASNIDLTLDSKGSGNVTLGANLHTNSNQIIVANGYGLLDTAGNEVLTANVTASAVNYLDVQNAATGGNVTIRAKGDDTNIGLNLVSKGSGNVTVNGSSIISASGTPAQGDLLYYNGSAWTRLPYGMSGYSLLTQGAGANPAWGAPAITSFTYWDEIVVTSEEMWLGAVSPAQDTVADSGSNDIIWKIFAYDASTIEYAWGMFRLPDDWDSATSIKCKVAWIGSSGDVVWSIAGLCVEDTLDYNATALGTAVTITDTAAAANRIGLTSATGAITFAGTPAAGKWVQFRVARNATDGSDTSASDAYFLSVAFQVKRVGTASAW